MRVATNCKSYNIGKIIKKMNIMVRAKKLKMKGAFRASFHYFDFNFASNRIPVGAIKYLPVLYHPLSRIE